MVSTRPPRGFPDLISEDFESKLRLKTQTSIIPFSYKSKTPLKTMPGEKMHPSLLRVNQHTERVRKELIEMISEMNHFYQRYSGLDEENEFLRESLVSLLNRINDESVSKELSDLGHEIRSKLGEFE